jgi:hypothetical protein
MLQGEHNSRSSTFAPPADYRTRHRHARRHHCLRALRKRRCFRRQERVVQRCFGADVPAKQRNTASTRHLAGQLPLATPYFALLCDLLNHRTPRLGSKWGEHKGQQYPPYHCHTPIVRIERQSFCRGCRPKSPKGLLLCLPKCRVWVHDASRPKNGCISKGPSHGSTLGRSSKGAMILTSPSPSLHNAHTSL